MADLLSSKIKHDFLVGINRLLALLVYLVQVLNWFCVCAQEPVCVPLFMILVHVCMWWLLCMFGGIPYYMCACMCA